MQNFNVLILIVLEDGLGGNKPSAVRRTCQSLNPYCLGGWSWRGLNHFCVKLAKSGLNPYCLGGWSWRILEAEINNTHDTVLILIVLEDGLGVTGKTYEECKGLNPYCLGGWSWRAKIVSS